MLFFSDLNPSFCEVVGLANYIHFSDAAAASDGCQESR
jgi:hypothetical protein